MFAKRFIQTIFFISILSATSHAETNPYQSCGPKANLVTRLLTDAEKIRLACINDVYDKITQQRDKEVAELTETIQNVKKNFKKLLSKLSTASFIVKPLEDTPHTIHKKSRAARSSLRFSIVSLIASGP